MIWGKGWWLRWRCWLGYDEVVDELLVACD
jgi:hypothetical protein